MKTPKEKLIQMIKSTKYTAEEVNAYWRKHSSKISIISVTIEIAKTENSKYIGKLCAANLCTDEQLKNDYNLYRLFQFSGNSFNKDKLTELLHTCGANPNKFFDGKTALYMAVGNNYNIETIETLLDHNADPSTGKLIASGDKYYTNSTFHEAATMADFNDNYEIIMLLMKKGYIFPPTLCSTTNGALFTADSCFVGKLNSIYQSPSNFLELSDDALIKYSHKQKSYLKLAALYGLKTEAKQLQISEKLTEAYIKKSTKLIEQINQKLENVAQKGNRMLEEERAKREAEEKKVAEQNTLFNKLNSVIKEETGEKCKVKGRDSKIIIDEGKEYSWFEKK